MKTSLRALENLSCTVFISYISGRACLHKCFVRGSFMTMCKKILKSRVEIIHGDFADFLQLALDALGKGRLQHPATGANTTTLTGSPGCSSCCIPQQTQPWVSGLSFHSRSLGLAQMLQVLPLSVHKLVLALVLVLCSATLVPEMAKRRIRSADLRMLGEENIGILWYEAFLLFRSHSSISIHLHWIHRIASLSHYLLLSQLFNDKLTKQNKQKNQPKPQFTPNFWTVEKDCLGI